MIESVYKKNSIFKEFSILTYTTIKAINYNNIFSLDLSSQSDNMNFKSVVKK